MDVIDPAKFAEENPNSRFRISNTATLAPGTCILCKSDGGDGRQFIDLGITVEWFGAMYFCTYCMAEAAQVLGLESLQNRDQIVTAHNVMVEQYNKLLAESMAVESAARTLLRNCHCEPVINSESFTAIDVEAIEEPEPNNPDSDESSGFEGSDDVSESSEDDESDSEPASKRRTRKSAE